MLTSSKYGLFERLRSTSKFLLKIIASLANRSSFPSSWMVEGLILAIFLISWGYFSCSETEKMTTGSLSFRATDNFDMKIQNMTFDFVWQISNVFGFCTKVEKLITKLFWLFFEIVKMSYESNSSSLIFVYYSNKLEINYLCGKKSLDKLLIGKISLI